MSARLLQERGASAVEYGLLVTAIAAIVILVVIAIGQFVKGTYDNTCGSFEGQIAGVTETCP